MLHSLVSALAAYPKAWQMIQRYRLWSFMIIPGLLSFLILGGVLIGIYHGAPQIGGWLMEQLGFTSVEGFWHNLASILTGILLVFLGLLSYKYLVQILVLPFMGPLSERVEQILTGEAPAPFRLGVFFRDVLRGLTLSLRNVTLELLWMLGLTLAGAFVPVVGSLLSTALIFVIQAYYAGFGNLDYTLERGHFGLRQRIKWVAAHRGLAIGNGTGFLLLLFIPVAGAILAPTLGTIAATLVGTRALATERV